ncbi:ABC transporter ATP-binding protein [Lentilactobacillus buchneri]|nr:ABC transporter ATP-binding protein [Lentilactobacillus sp. Egmn17]
MTTKIVQTEDLHKTYDKDSAKPYEALKGISLSVNEGEFVGIMGASGSGKTTLLNILATLDQPTSGSVEIDGQDVTHLTANQMADFRSQKLGFIFQDFNLLETLTAQENIALPLSLQNAKAAKIQTAVKEAASKLGIDDLLSKYPTQLSGGQKQRVAAARALVSNPSIIFHDPFSASFCKRILFIKDGKIGDELDAGDKPRNEFYQEILEKLGTFEQ